MVMARIEQARHREGVHHPRRREDVLMAVAPGRIAVLIHRIVIARGAAPHPDGPLADPRLRFTDLHRIRSEERQYLRIGLWIWHGQSASATRIQHSQYLACRVKATKGLVGAQDFTRCHPRNRRENLSVDARLRAPSDPLAAFLFISESGDLIDQLIGERSLRLIAILFGPACPGLGSGLLLADPGEEGVVDAGREIGRELEAEELSGTGLVVGHKNHEPGYDLDAARILAGALRADADMVHQLSERLAGPEVENDAVGHLGAHLNHPRPQGCDIEGYGPLERRLRVAVTLKSFQIEVRLLAPEHGARHD